MEHFVSAHSEWLTALSILSAVMFFGSLIIVPALLARMPADYFVREQPLRRDDASHWAWWLAGKVFKNSLGGLLFLAGVAMLVLPGQGLITMLIGMTLIDFPGKRALELAIIRRPRILRTINWLRARSGKPPVITELSPDTPPEVHRR